MRMSGRLGTGVTSSPGKDQHTSEARVEPLRRLQTRATHWATLEQKPETYHLQQRCVLEFFAQIDGVSLVEVQLEAGQSVRAPWSEQVPS